jgi:alpha-L-fucosidase
MKRRNFLNTAFIGLTGLGLPIFSPLDTMGEKINLAGQSGPLKRFGDGRDWFFKKRYGMFIHWGLYSIPGWHEQHQYRGKVDRKTYAQLAQKWNPDNFDPDKWLDVLEDAGMEYLCITTKHIDGFCLWDTKYTDFKTTNTPFKKDILEMLANACHKRDIPLCLYYSIVDNNHPNYPNMGRPYEVPPQPDDSPDVDKYVEFLKSQVKELCTNYGKISGFWWDANSLGIKDPSVNQMIREMQPNAVINDRGFDDGDFGTPERDYKPDDNITFTRLTEACQSIGKESWGYRLEEDYYTDRHLICSIDRYLTRDANYLLNVGPKPDGSLSAESINILTRIGTWYEKVKESLLDVEYCSTLTYNRDVTLTSRGNNLYVHLNRNILTNAVELAPINVSPKRATLLNNGQKTDFRIRFNPSDHKDNNQKAYLNLINLPVNDLSNTALVVKLEFDCHLDEIVLAQSKQDGILGPGK